MDTEIQDAHISVLVGRTPDQERTVAETVKQMSLQEAGAKSEATPIVFVEIAHADRAAGGVPVEDSNRKP